MAEDQNEVQEEKKTSQKNPLVAVLLLTNAVALGAVAFMQYKFLKHESEQPDLAQLLKDMFEKMDKAFTKEHF